MARTFRYHFSFLVVSVITVAVIVSTYNTKRRLNSHSIAIPVPVPGSLPAHPSSVIHDDTDTLPAPVSPTPQPPKPVPRPECTWVPNPGPCRFFFRRFFYNWFTRVSFFSLFLPLCSSPVGMLACVNPTSNIVSKTGRSYMYIFYMHHGWREWCATVDLCHVCVRWV